jgi:uncharacterized membrane protein YdbT with pleckstrin-like domain
MRRCSSTLLAIRAVDALKVYLPFMLVQGGIAVRLPPQLLWLWYALLTYYTLTRLQLLLFDWLTVRYAVSPSGVVCRRGWPTSVTTRASWSEIGALHVEQDLTHQLLRRFRVRAVVGAEGRAEIELDALDASAVAALRAFHESAQGVAVPPVRGEEAAPSGEPRVGSGAAAPARQGRRVLFRAGTRDYLLISVGYGQFILLVPFLLGAWSDVAEMLGLPDGAVLLEQALGAGLLAVLGFVPVAAAFGIVRTWVTYRGYCVTLDSTGIEARGGLLRQDVRRARLDEVSGIRVTQNPLLKLLGRYSVSLVLASARGEFRVLVVLPVASVAQVRRLQLRLVPDAAKHRLLATRVPGRVVTVVLVTGAVGVAATALAGLPWLAAAIALLAVALCNACWVQVEVPRKDGTVFRHRGGLLWRRDYLLATAALRQVESWAWTPGGSSGRSWARLRIMDRRPVSLWLPAVPTHLVDQLTDCALRRPREEAARCSG